MKGYGRAVRLVRDKCESIFGRAYDRLILWPDQGGWVLDEEAEALRDTCKRLGVKVRLGAGGGTFRCIHYLSQFVLNEAEHYLSEPTCRYSISYYHGGPCDAEFSDLFAQLARNRQRLTKVHVSNSTMAGYLREAGFMPEQIAQVPIGINVEMFPLQTEEAKVRIRRHLKVPEDAFVVGSFQKDGVGWGEGHEPKLIKGPDLFVQTMAQLKTKIPSLFVLLSGPARGYVKNGLEQAGVPYRHVYYRKPGAVAGLYQALDCYLVSSRVEGGPKSILESMASGVPLVSTNVGQGVDLMSHGENAYVVNPKDVAALASGVLTAYRDPDWFQSLRSRARATAEKHDHVAQTPLWRDSFLKNYVEP